MSLIVALLVLNWIHSKIICATTFCITGLAKITKIEFPPLDWIYRSIRIIMVVSILTNSEPKSLSLPEIKPLEGESSIF